MHWDYDVPIWKQILMLILLIAAIMLLGALIAAFFSKGLLHGYWGIILGVLCGVVGLLSHTVVKIHSGSAVIKVETPPSDAKVAENNKN